MAFVGHLLLMNEILILERNKELRVYRRVLRDTNNPFDLSDTHFKIFYCLKKNCVRMLIDNLRNYLTRKRST